MILSILASLALATDPGPAFQSPPPTRALQQDRVTATQLEDVVVTGRSLDRLISEFVGEVAEPNRHRGLARWDQSICVGVANLRVETAEYLADRISTVAGDLGLAVGDPGCTPNILVVATADGNALARDLVRERRRAFRMGGSGMDRGGDALEDFVATDRPVRWWQMSMPVNSETGERAVRIPGECLGSCSAARASALDYAPKIEVFAASRIRTQIVDNLIRTVVIVDVNRVGHLSALQLADYIAMVSLAQIDPDADTGAYASILNVFDDPQGASSLMAWDTAYLEGLYRAERNEIGRAARGEIVDSIRDAHARHREAGEDTGGEGVSH